MLYSAVYIVACMPYIGVHKVLCSAKCTVYSAQNIYTQWTVLEALPSPSRSVTG